MNQKKITEIFKRFQKNDPHPATEKHAKCSSNITTAKFQAIEKRLNHFPVLEEKQRM